MAEQHVLMVRIGIGGWIFEPWRGRFYPQDLPRKRELAYAASKLSSIEINGTYYGSPKPESFAKWYEDTPAGFVFSLKAPRFSTNRRVLAEGAASMDRFFASGIAQLKEKLGPINWQFPGTKQFDPSDLEAFLKLLPREIGGWPLRHALEVRHESFKNPNFVALVRDYEVAIVFAGDSKFVQIADITAPFVYVRIMGTRTDEPAGYTLGELDLWAERVKQLAAGIVPKDFGTIANPIPQVPREVFLYVISGAKETNPAAAQALIERL